MNYFNEHICIEEIKAENLIAQMDTKDNFDVRMRGIFSRNYAEDLLSVQQDEGNFTFELSRDGIFQLLPENLFFEENKLKNFSKGDFKDNYKQFEKEKKQFELFFQVFDREYFKQSLALEETLNDIAEKGNAIFEPLLEDVFEADTDNEYILKLKKLLPFASQIRGNLALLTDVLKNVFSVKKIDVKKTKPLFVLFIIHKEGLSKEEYLEINKKADDFFDYFCRWFMSVELECDYKFKDYSAPFTLGNTLILDYNTNL
jgi:hypothetical protein